MNCNDTQEQLALYAGNDLERSERVAVEDHLQTCAACRDELEAYRTVRSDLQALRGVDVRESDVAALSTAVMRRVQNDRARRTRKFATTAVLVATAALLSVVSTWFITGKDTSPPSAVEVTRQTETAPADVLSNAKDDAGEWSQAPAENAVASKSSAPADNPRKRDRVVARIVTDNPNIVIIWLADDDEEEGSINEKSSA